VDRSFKKAQRENFNNQKKQGVGKTGMFDGEKRRQPRKNFLFVISKTIQGVKRGVSTRGTFNKKGNSYKEEVGGGEEGI